MKAMILAAGLGTRLRPLTDYVSKPMVRLAGRPCLEHTIRLLKKHGFNDLIINLHYKPELIRDYFGHGEKFGLTINYSFEQELMGTAGGVKKVEQYFSTGPVLIISGDALTDIDLYRFFCYHRDNGAMATLALKQVANPVRYGVVITDANGLITAFQEKPLPGEEISNLANTGIYLFEPSVFTHIPENSFFDFGRDLFPLLLKQGEKMAGYTMREYWCDIGDLNVYREAHYDMLTGLVEVDIPGKRFESNIWLGKQPDIDPRATVVGPAVIGDRCVIEKNAQIYGPVVLGKGTVIGEGTVIKRGIFWGDVRVGENSHLVDCIVGEHCRVAPGLFLENQVLDNQILDNQILEGIRNLGERGKI